MVHPVARDRRVRIEPSVQVTYVQYNNPDKSLKGYKGLFAALPVACGSAARVDRKMLDRKIGKESVNQLTPRSYAT